MTRVAVVGAGIIGISTGLELQRRGFSVTLFDPEPADSKARASYGNAGAFAYSDFLPLATPGIMRKVPKWLFDPLGPLSVPLGYAPDILPWLIRFGLASRPGRFAKGVETQSNLMHLSRAALERQLQNFGGEDLLQRDGQLQVYESEAEFQSTQFEWQLREQYGIPFQLLRSPEEIAELQPGLHPRFTHGGFVPQWVNVSDPLKWLNHRREAFLKLGGQIEQLRVVSLSERGPEVVLSTSDGERRAEFAVVAAGAHSNAISRTLGENFPLETERGYNTTLPPGSFDLRMHITFSGHGFVLSRINGGIRVGGAVELGGLKAPPNYKRSEALLQRAKSFIPELEIEGGEQWMGFRPSMPDTAPVIDWSAKMKRLVYAFGHGHSGLTQSAATAELVSDLIENRTPAIPMEPFSAKRF